MFGLSSIATSIIGYGAVFLALSGAAYGVKVHIENDAERASYVTALERGIQIKADADAASLADAKKLLAAANARADMNAEVVADLLKAGAETSPVRTCSDAVAAAQRSLR